MTAMHADELPIDEDLVRRLLLRQFPQWAALPLRRIEPAGTVNAIFRLGDEFSVRLPRLDGPTTTDSREMAWLTRLAPLLPLAIPIPVAQGAPTVEYPWFWEIHRWVVGETVPVELIDGERAARDLAGFVAALQRIPADGAPPGRGIPLAERDMAVRAAIVDYPDRRALHAWEEACAADPWDGPPIWHHGDLDARNWLVDDGRISGVIDWALMGVGDPACDVMVAWKLHSAAARDVFRRELPVDEATWVRARGWVVSQAVMALVYYTPQNNPTLYRECESWLELALTA